MKQLQKEDEYYSEALLLMQQAWSARQMAYAPYSGFCVGAALLCEDGSIVTGCNVENAAYSPSNCAERTAVFKAISDGKRSFISIAVIGAAQNEMPSVSSICTPCGVCRQVLSEFCEPKKLRIYMTNGSALFAAALEDLLPYSFGAKNL